MVGWKLFNQMSSFIKHIPCQSCGSKDNRGVFTDGHEYCWGCRDYLPAPEARYKDQSEAEPQRQGLSLPNDSSRDIPIAPLRWLKGYGLTNQEIIQNNFVWSPSRSLLISRVLSSSDTLTLWQGRYFGSDPNHPKYFTKGNKEELHIIGSGKDIVLVEDLISAIKVGRHVASLTMWGSGIPLIALKRLSERFKRLWIWNDLDKLDEARRTAKKALLFDFESITVVQTQNDPKDYSDTEIREWLNLK